MLKALMQKIRYPANQNLDFMDVKQLSEEMEAEHLHAKEAISRYLHKKKKYERACERYALQCSRKTAYSKR